MPRPIRDPSYRLHKQSGQAIVTLPDGLGSRRDVLLGVYDSPASWDAYYRTLAEWKNALTTMAGAWAPMQTAVELHDDEDIRANGYIATVTASTGAPFALPTNPVQFDETSPDLSHAPDHGQHTEEVLLELGLTWPEIAGHKESGAIL